MAKLVLQFEGRVLKEYPLAASITIGRLPDNTIAIDNPAVSARHARVIQEGDASVVEDLDSRNGTFVNDARVTRRALRNGDVVMIGKHRLVFDQLAKGLDTEVTASELVMPDFGGTVVLDTVQQRRLLAAVDAQMRARAAAADTKAPRVVSADESEEIGVLRVVCGRTAQLEYRLHDELTTIGKAESALVRLEGWFKPKLALTIARFGDGYVATAERGRTFVNGQRLRGRRGLIDGDVLEVGGLTLEFRTRRRLAA